MKTETDLSLAPETCLAAMHTFWQDNIEAVKTGDGVALSLPLMYPDGWQVTVQLAPITPG